MLVEQMANAYWKLARVNVAERCLLQTQIQFLRHANDRDGWHQRNTELEGGEMSLKEALVGNAFEMKLKVLNTCSAYESRLERNWSCALRDLQRLQAIRAALTATATPDTHKAPLTTMETVKQIEVLFRPKYSRRPLIVPGVIYGEWILPLEGSNG